MTDHQQKKISFAEQCGCIVLGIIVIIGTFPENDWSFSPGIDFSLCWLYNYLFSNNLALGKHIIFPHGPLAFFMYPLPDNVLLTVTVTSLLKIGLVLNVFCLLIDEKKLIKWIVTGIVAYGFSVIANFNNLLLITILLLYCNYFTSGKKLFKYIAFFLTAFSLYVKAYIAIVSGLLFFSFVLYWLFTLKRIKQALMDCTCLLGLMLILWTLMYGTLSGFPDYCWGMIHLAQDNSSAAAYYPHNNWPFLILFFLLFATIFLINRTRKAGFYLVLIALGLFATWKHGMAREDVFHVQGLFVYVITCLLVFILFQKKKVYLNIALAIATIGVFSVNKKNAVGYYPLEYDVLRADRFFDFVSNFAALKREANRISQKNSAVNVLPEKVRNAIGTATIDIYPWEYSIVAANKLNWQPRVVIQSYASYTSWLDEQNAKHFNSAKAPDYLIWELKKVSADMNGGDMNSIDGRYLLNDEPQTMVELLRNYEYYYSDQKFHIVKKRVRPLSTTSSMVGHMESAWGEWMDVPPVKENLLRAKLNFSKTLFQQLKSFLYKDEQFWIYLKLANGAIHKYRIVPKNAVDGLWINPYVFNTSKSYMVDKIMFQCSMRDKLTDKLAVDWEEIEFPGSPDLALNFFNIHQFTGDSVVFSSINTYEEKAVKDWSDLADILFSTDPFTGSRSHLLEANSYSSTFEVSLDSVDFQNLRIVTDCWIKASNYKLGNTLSLVISLEDANGAIVWRSLPVDEQLIDEGQWNNVNSIVDYTHDVAHRKIKVYVYNMSKQDVLIDDFRVVMLKN